MTTVDVLGKPVRGDGMVLFHEHLVFGWPGFELDPLAAKTVPVADAVRVFNELADAGYGVFVDATPVECGRDLGLLAEAARSTRLQIVGAAGIYESTRGFPTHLASLSVDDLVAFFEADLSSEAAAGRAGVLKIATRQPPFAQREAKAVRAAGLVSAKHDIPIVSHAESVAGARAQLEILLEAGASPGRIALGHLDTEWERPDHVASLAAEGVFIGIDRFSGQTEEGIRQRVGLISALKDRGHVGAILLSHDAPFRFLGRPRVGAQGDRNPFLLIKEHALPALREAGLSEDEVHHLTVENPARFLGAGR